MKKKVRISSFLLLRNYYKKLHCVLAGYSTVAQSALFSPDTELYGVRSTEYGYTTCSTAIPCTKGLSVKQWLSLVSLPFVSPLLFSFSILPSSLLSVYVCPTPVEPSLPPREPGIIVPG